MKAVAVLCGGRGTRLGGAGQKCLTVVEDRPFLHWKLDQLVDHGVTELHLLVSYCWDDVFLSIGRRWQNVPVSYHLDAGLGTRKAHVAAELPFVHWLTYGDALLDVPLRHSMYPYIYFNDEFPLDAGTQYCWGHNFLALPRRTDAPSYHINTPQDLENARAYLRRHGAPR